MTKQSPTLASIALAYDSFHPPDESKVEPLREALPAVRAMYAELERRDGRETKTWQAQGPNEVLFRNGTSIADPKGVTGPSREDDDYKAMSKAAAVKHKKTIPLYIGLTTGFCGSFTSFSSFARAFFPCALSSFYHDAELIWDRRDARIILAT